MAQNGPYLNPQLNSNTMNRKKFALLAASAMLMASAYDKKIFDTGASTVYAKKITKQDLPRWDVGGHVIFAKDEKTAEKYAKKRGFWVSGTIVKPI